MTNEQVLFIANNLTAVDAPDMEPDFNYAVSGNLTEAERVAKKIRDALKPSEEIEKYEKKMQALREKYAVKDDDGNPKIITTPLPKGRESKQYDIPGSESETSPFSKAVDKLKKEFKTEIDKHEAKMDWLQEENKDFTPEWIDKEDIPVGLSRQAMDALYFVIKKPEKK